MNNPIKILYVDDNPHDQELVIDSLEKENSGFEVTLASNKEDFENFLKQNKFDIVLSDFNILGYEGLSVLKTVNHFNPDIPVIIVTGTGSEEVAVEAMKLGAEDYVIKSISHIRHLPLTINAIIEKRQLKLLHNKTQDELLKLRKAVENSGEIIFMTDRDGIFTFINPEFTVIYGFTSEEVIGKCTPRILRGISKSPVYYEKLWNKLLNGMVIKGEFVNKTKYDSLLNIEFSINPVFDDNNEIKNFLAIQRDITERKRAEDQLQRQFEELEIAKGEAEKADRLKTEFLAQISHEIRTPINSILNFSSLIKDDVYDMVNDDSKFSFEAVERASLRLIRTIDLILNMSELQTESYYPTFKGIDIIEILEHLIQDLALVAKEKDLSLIFTKPGFQPKIFGDEYTVVQILQNLFDNALKYTDKGQIEVKLNDSENYLSISIADTGIGISEEYLPKLFTPFSQEYSGYTRLYDGNGLGLAIVKKYIEVNKGQIQIQSIKGKGTTVTVTFHKHPFD